VESPQTSRLARIIQYYAHIHAGTQYVVLHIKLMINAHTKMYAHNSQINADHDVLNTDHAKTDTDVLKNTRLYKL